MSKQRIVLDTNCLLQIIPSRSTYRKIWDAFLSGKYYLCITTSILNEYEEIIGIHSSKDVAISITTAIINSPYIIKVDPFYNFYLIYSDPDDNKFVDCAIASNARYIVTEDSHFNVLRQIEFPKVNITRLDDYLKELEACSEE